MEKKNSGSKQETPVIEASGVYAIACDISEGVYVGETQCGFWNRWLQHINMLDKQRHWIKSLQADWNQYGQSGFSFIVLEVIPDGEERRLGGCERDWIKHALDTGPYYNNGAGVRCAYIRRDGDQCRNMPYKNGTICYRHVALIEDEKKRAASSVTYYPINKSMGLNERDFAALRQLAHDWDTSMVAAISQLIREEDRRRQYRIRLAQQRKEETR